MDRYSLGLAPKSLALEAVQFYTDLYMRRSFHMSILPFKPDLVVFLGDHFDGGPFLSDEEWQESLSRFRHIFGLNEKGKLPDIPVFFLSGNHDIGYANIHTLHPKVIRRYEKEFGARNYHFSAGNISFVVVDAQTLDGPIEGKQTLFSWEFIKNMSKEITLTPRVLLTHIPLYRRDDTPCGQFRSSGIINQRVSQAGVDQGVTYQNYLTEETSARLLNSIKPILVLSGHDHDQCTVTHSTPFGPVTEHTLGTLSWQQGNLYPSFMLLTATSQPFSNASDSVLTQLCFLPMQTHIYIWYLLQFVSTLILLVTWPTNGFGCYERLMDFIRAIKSEATATSKEKDDEDNCEYEMVWDAQGSMHLVKKAAMTDPIPRPDAGLVSRGNVVARPAAKKQNAQEAETAVLLEMGADVKSEISGKVSRSSKSKVRRLVQRLIRVSQLLVVIAAVNFPIYMMLLFKDWIDR